MNVKKRGVDFQEMAVSPATFKNQRTFDKFLELIGEFPARCTYEYKGDKSFHTRWIATQVAGGSATRWSCAAHTTRRTENDIADSAPSGYGLLYAMAGGVAFKQGRNEITVAPGNAVLYDLDQPLQIDMLTAPQRDFLLITLPRENIMDPVSNGVSSRARLVTNRTPLLQCVDHLATALAKRNGRDFSHVFNACEKLVMVEFLASDECFSSRSNDLMETIRSLIEIEIGDPELSPQWLANRLGVSVRYIHKLFASRGLTCQGYITSERLSYARQDLMCATNKIRIASLAPRWGFSDSASFGRAFKNRFGEPPGKYREKRRT
jgi:AraC-like DNA-binding protein